ncbi:DNA polymerase III subunit alpha [Candidatus Palauibacter sp.]|uniref:DNA polymerase III subunit alpha n=1 Tax=Candidatus Palauibacter sp. TaxID=3101350 RepID=UPI003B5B7BEF
MQFVHLHTHSEYSLLDGANRIDDLVDRAVALGMPALALTDHGNLFGAWEFQEKARAKGITPIIGCEAYVAYGDRRARKMEPGAPANYAHLILLAENRTGYSNLIKLSSIGYTEGFYHRPRVDHAVLEEHAEGLICLSACLAGEVARYLQHERYDDAKRTAEWHARVFSDRYWLELQDHGIPKQDQVNRGIIQLSEELGLPLVLTNDAHYMRREDADVHDTLLCIGTGKDKDDPDRLRFHGEESYFKTAEEMAELFPDLPGLLSETVRIAERCEVRVEKQYRLPTFPLPDRFSDPMELLRHQATEGAKARYGDPLPDPVRERLGYELEVIENTGYAGYLLIVWDFIVAARERGIPVGPGRGSAAGSIICYALGITDVDPLEFDLLFERFLNPERVSMPDIDIDFCYERRGEVIDYVREKYGQASVGQIITFGTMKARAVIRDVGRVLGFSPSDTDRLAKLVPSSPGFSLTVSQARKKVGELAELDREDPQVAKLLDYAERIEGLSRHSSVHAAGVVIAPGPLDDYVPVYSDTRTSADTVITQFDMNALEKAGLLKMDFLGLRTLTVIADAARNVEERHGRRVDWEEIGLEDPAVYGMLAAGRTSGVFQFESSLATDKLRAMRCDRFDDLVAVNALIRPGPLDSGMTDVYIARKRGLEEVEYPHPDLEEILEPTYGVITYQEQVMRAANLLAGFTLAEADVLRKAVGKKDAELTDRVLGEFVARAAGRGVAKAKAREIAELIRTFGRYGFNKAHSVAYALLSYRTAWLKAHYPAEFMAGLLSSEIGSTDAVVSYIGASRLLGIRVLPPSVKESGYRFTVVDDPDDAGKSAIRFGLGAIKGVGHSAIQSIRAARGEAPFESFMDFLERIDLRLNNSRVIQALIGAGAVDDLGDRAALVEGLDVMMNEAQLRRQEAESGQTSLFGEDADAARPSVELPAVPAWSERNRLREEKERLGFYISGHPLERYRDLVELYAVEARTTSLPEHRDRTVEIPCVITEASVRTARRDGREWARLTIEDFHGTATTLAFGDIWQKNRGLLTDDRPVLITGTVSGNSRDDEDPPIFLDSVRPLADVRDEGQVGILIELREDEPPEPGAFDRARELLEASRGRGPLYLEWRAVARRDESGTEPVDGGPVEGGEEASPPRFESGTLRVSPTAALVEELRALLGSGVKLVRSR